MKYPQSIPGEPNAQRVHQYVIEYSSVDNLLDVTFITTHGEPVFPIIFHDSFYSVSRLETFYWVIDADNQLWCGNEELYKCSADAVILRLSQELGFLESSIEAINTKKERFLEADEKREQSQAKRNKWWDTHDYQEGCK
jgi:hypothetical protein